MTVGKYLCAEIGGGTIIVANRTAASEWETFRVIDFTFPIVMYESNSFVSKNLVLSFVFVLGMQLWRINENTFQMRVFHKQFVGLDTGGNGIDVVAVAGTPGMSETFEIVWNSGDSRRVRIKAPNGFFLQVSVSFGFVVFKL